MGILRYIFKSDEDLDNEYEKERQRWMNTGFNGDGTHTKKMKSINKEMRALLNEMPSFL